VTKAPLKRAERASARRTDPLPGQAVAQSRFVEFVLSQCVEAGEAELDDEKLPRLLTLKYGTASEAVRSVGTASSIRELFRRCQGELYSGDSTRSETRLASSPG
jgi:type I restriction enzyme R subunit